MGLLEALNSPMAPLGLLAATPISGRTLERLYGDLKGGLNPAFSLEHTH